jgi:hypothetical protein
VPAVFVAAAPDRHLPGPLRVDRILTEDELAEQLRSFEHTAFRLEQQRAYIVPVENEMFLRLLARTYTPLTSEAPLIPLGILQRTIDLY